METFFFSSDSDGDWYMLPTTLRDKWIEKTANDIAWNDYDAQEEFEQLFGAYRTGGGIDHIDFVPVNKEP